MIDLDALISSTGTVSNIPLTYEWSTTAIASSENSNYELIIKNDGVTIQPKERKSNNMKIIKVKFKNGNEKVYYYKTKIENLLVGGVYDIIADNKTEYNNYVIVLNTDCEHSAFMGDLREITYARLIQAPNKPNGNIENIWINEAKGTTVIKWKDGTKTKVRCQNDEEFDAEKGIALCFMKKAFDNRACFNDVFKKYIEEENEDD